MDVTPLIPAGRQIVESYGSGGFKVSGKSYVGAIVVFPDRTVGWNIASVSVITSESLSGVSEAGRAGGVDVLLIGCGARMAPIPSTIRQGLRTDGIVVEAMDTGAACRTYNVLMSEGRRVAAALIAVK
jgi:uncharacterized protein